MNWDIKRVWNKIRQDSIARAIAISLAIHVFTLVVAEYGHQVGWWRNRIVPDWARKMVPILADKPSDPKLADQVALAKREEEPMIFIEVDPSDASPTPPKDTKFYSSASSVAANPNPQPVNKPMPKIDGKQEKVPSTKDTSRGAAKPVETPPTEPKPEVPTPKNLQPQQSQQEKPKVVTGDIVVAKNTEAQPLQPNLSPNPQQPTPPKRPRTIAEAKAQKGIIETPKMKMDGGASRAALESNLDVKGSPFGAYDAAFIAAVQARWFSLLDQRDFVRNHTGKVVVNFRLNKDGRITELGVIENETNETLSWICQRAILDPAPYQPFPSDLRRMLNADYREVRFTFYYN